MLKQLVAMGMYKKEIQNSNLLLLFSQIIRGNGTTFSLPLMSENRQGRKVISGREEKSFNSPENVLLSLQTGFFARSLMSASAPLSDLDLPPGHLMEGRRCRPAVILVVI